MNLWLKQQKKTKTTQRNAFVTDCLFVESRIETLQTFPVSTGLIVDVVILSSTEIAFEILTLKRRFMRMAEHYLMKAFHKKCQLKLWM